MFSGLMASSGEERKRKRDEDDDDEEPAPKRSPPSLTALLRHPKNAHIRLSNLGGIPALRYDGVRIYGLLRRLKAIFYPNYSYETARHVDRTVPEGESTIPFSEDGARKGGRSHSIGAARGSAVDADLRLWVNSPGEFKRKKTHPPMCVDIISAFEKWEWTGIVAQFPLVAESIGVWTPADVVVSDSAGKSILTEIKTGYKSYLYSYSGMMAGPLSDKPDTPMNQHYLQVGIEMLIALRCYGFRFDKCYVVQAINDMGVIPHALPAWFTERESQIWDYFSTQAMRGVGEVPSAARDRGPVVVAAAAASSRRGRGFRR